jgi:hypothetical protein
MASASEYQSALCRRLAFHEIVGSAANREKPQDIKKVATMDVVLIILESGVEHRRPYGPLSLLSPKFDRLKYGFLEVRSPRVEREE